MRTVAIIQARMGSSRLPGKILRPMAGVPMLAHVVNRARQAATLDDVVLATTTEPADDVVEALCAARGWPCFRGSQDDVLDRYYQAARCFRADVVVRLTGDCPLIDPELIDQVVSTFRKHRPDYASNVLPPRTYPRGLDTEVFSFAALECAWREDGNPAWREHVTPYLHQSPDRFRLLRVPADDDYSHHRWTVDTAEDYALAVRIHEAFGRDNFGWRDILDLANRHSEWGEMNRHVIQRDW